MVLPTDFFSSGQTQCSFCPVCRSLIGRVVISPFPGANFCLFTIIALGWHYIIMANDNIIRMIFIEVEFDIIRYHINSPLFDTYPDRLWPKISRKVLGRCTYSSPLYFHRCLYSHRCWSHIHQRLLTRKISYTLDNLQTLTFKMK